MRTAGECTINTNYRGQQYRFRAIVVQGTKNNLLSRAVAREMSLIQRVEELNVFGTCGLMRTDPVAIHVKEDAKPYAIMTACRVPFPIGSKVEEELKRLQKNGVVVPVEGPSDWCAPMVPVMKKNGKVRITVDYKPLN